MSGSNIAFAKDEEVRSEYKLGYSLNLFFIKTRFTLTNKRLIGDIPNVFLVIPLGNNNVTYPLNSIANVKIGNGFKPIRFFIGLALIGFGITNLSAGNLIVLVLGALMVVSSYYMTVIIQTAAGSLIYHQIAPHERAKGQQLVNDLNLAIAEKM